MIPINMSESNLNKILINKINYFYFTWLGNHLHLLNFPLVSRNNMERLTLQLWMPFRLHIIIEVMKLNIWLIEALKGILKAFHQPLLTLPNVPEKNFNKKIIKLHHHQELPNNLRVPKLS